MTTPGQTSHGVTVAALLVSHDGARWLPTVLDALAAQTRQPDVVVAVDTGSADASPGLLRDRLGTDVVQTAPADASFGAAVRKGLSEAPATDWVWLLHDDSAPDPRALEVLLRASADQPSVSVLGPKLRDWPSLKRLLEVGVTISGTGRRETGLESGEYDQGQHDRVREVLAVNTAGMLVRRSMLESLGFDEHLPVLGNDIDFGWRAARAGHRTVVVPDAVVFHAEAAHRGNRRTELTGARRRSERAAALYTLLVNCAGLALPFVALRLLGGSLLRALGLLVVRAPREAGDEMAALVSTYVRPGRVWSGRRARRRSATVPARDVRHLLAPAWLPYRHGLDFLTEVGLAVARQVGDLSARRSRLRNAADTAETGPVAPEAQSLPADTGLTARLLASPVAWTFTALLVAAVVAARDLLGSGALSGGALLPAPDGALDWWRTYLTSHHDVGVGSAAPAPPYLVPLAVLGSVLVGKASLVVDLLFLLAVPVAAFGAYRFLLRVTSSWVASLWGAAAYGVLPVVTGAVQEGRLGTVAGALVLPWLAHSALFLGGDVSPDRRARAAWRTSLWLALLVAFVPVAWALAAAVAAVAVAAGRGRNGTVWVLVPVLASLVLVLPWSWSTWFSGGPVSWLHEAGLPVPPLGEPLSRWDLVLGRPGGDAPGWLTAGVVVAAVAALLRPDTRLAVLRAWVVIAVALVVTAVLAGRSYPSTTGEGPQPLWLGFPLVVAQAAAISAAAIAGAGIRRRWSESSFGWQQPVGAVVVCLALATPVLSTAWWVWTGSDGPLDRAPATSVPTYMSDAAAADPVNGVLVVRGSRTRGFDYVVVRGSGPRLGAESLQPEGQAQAGLTRRVADLATAPEPSDVDALARLGVAYVYAPAPADTSLVGNLDSVSGMSPGSAGQPGARAWRVEAAPSDADLSRSRDRVRPWLLAVQGLAVLVVVVLAAPSRRGRR